MVIAFLEDDGEDTIQVGYFGFRKHRRRRRKVTPVAMSRLLCNVTCEHAVHRQAQLNLQRWLQEYGLQHLVSEH